MLRAISTASNSVTMLGFTPPVKPKKIEQTHHFKILQDSPIHPSIFYFFWFVLPCYKPIKMGWFPPWTDPLTQVWRCSELRRRRLVPQRGVPGFPGNDVSDRRIIHDLSFLMIRFLYMVLLDININRIINIDIHRYVHINIDNIDNIDYIYIYTDVESLKMFQDWNSIAIKSWRRWEKPADLGNGQPILGTTPEEHDRPRVIDDR